MMGMMLMKTVLMMVIKLVSELVLKGSKERNFSELDFR